METITISSGSGYQQHITGQETHFTSDLSSDKGGEGTAPDPHHLLYGAWGACTNMTIQLYCKRKGWPLQAVTTQFEIEEGAGTPVIHKHVSLQGNLTAAQQVQIQRIAEHCPVNKLILGKPEVHINWLFSDDSSKTGAS